MTSAQKSLLNAIWNDLIKRKVIQEWLFYGGIITESPQFSRSFIVATNTEWWVRRVKDIVDYSP